jgi:hypothetical protein
MSRKASFQFPIPYYHFASLLFRDPRGCRLTVKPISLAHMVYIFSPLLEGAGIKRIACTDIGIVTLTGEGARPFKRGCQISFSNSGMNITRFERSWAENSRRRKVSRLL